MNSKDSNNKQEKVFGYLGNNLLYLNIFEKRDISRITFDICKNMSISDSIELTPDDIELLDIIVDRLVGYDDSIKSVDEYTKDVIEFVKSNIKMDSGKNIKTKENSDISIEDIISVFASAMPESLFKDCDGDTPEEKVLTYVRKVLNK